MAVGGVRTLAVAVALAVTAAALVAWTALEARRQRREVIATLTAEASVLASSLGPGLSAASSAARELDELVTLRLLDNARLLAALGPEGRSGSGGVAALVDANGLEGVAFLGSDGREERIFGETPPEAAVSDVMDFLAGPGEELILGSLADEEVTHLRVAVRRAQGGAVLVQLDASGARTMARAIGVENLLGRLVRGGGVLYLVYRREPGPVEIGATWDGEEVPIPAAEAATVRTTRGRSVFEVAVPLESAAGERATLRVGLDGAPLERAAAAAMRRTLLVGLVLATLALAGVTVAAVGRLRERERREAAERLAAAEEARRRSERLAAAGALTAGLAHEVRNPLNAIGLAAQRLERKLAERADLSTLAGTIRQEVRRLEDVLREFLELANPSEQKSRAVDLAALTREVVGLLAAEADAANVALSLAPGSGVVPGDAGALKRAIINLVQNALQASRPESRVTVFVEHGREMVTVRVRDDGPGIDPALGERIYEPFVSGRPQGTGLGLALVRRVADQHGGSVRLEKRSAGGVDAVLRLPTGRGGRE